MTTWKDWWVWCAKLGSGWYPGGGEGESLPFVEMNIEYEREVAKLGELGEPKGSSSGFDFDLKRNWNHHNYFTR